MHSRGVNKIAIAITAATVFLYLLFAYQLERTEFLQLIVLYALLCGSYFYILKKQQNNLPFLIGLCILFRLVFLFSTPNLSQDFYRFIWDGRMLLAGMNPYLHLPETFIKQLSFPVHQAIDLYHGMGTLNGSHYTNYPPINQACFLIAAFFANKSILGSVIIMRSLIILADIGILYFGKKIAEHLNMPRHTIFWYLLNPFIIIEMTGNLHFEPVMLFFLLWALYALFKNKWRLAALLIACSISVKLIPFLVLPLFFQWFVKKEDSLKKGLLKLGVFYGIIALVSVVLFLPFYSHTFLQNYSNSIGLWFRDFEFNASFYYVFRAIGYLFRGYNEIAIIGKTLPIATLVYIGYSTFFRKNKSPKQLITALLFGLSFYYFTTTTMHPWYLASLLLLAVFTKYKFPIVWSLVIFLSYATYRDNTYKEPLLLIGIEYLIVYGFLMWELFFKKKFNLKSSHII